MRDACCRIWLCPLMLDTPDHPEHPTINGRSHILHLSAAFSALVTHCSALSTQHSALSTQHSSLKWSATLQLCRQPTPSVVPSGVNCMWVMLQLPTSR